MVIGSLFYHPALRRSLQTHQSTLRPGRLIQCLPPYISFETRIPKATTGVLQLRPSTTKSRAVILTMNFLMLLIALLVSLVAGAPAATSTPSLTRSLTLSSTTVHPAIPTPSSTGTPEIPATPKCPQTCLDEITTCQQVCASTHVGLSVDTPMQTRSASRSIS